MSTLPSSSTVNGVNISALMDTLHAVRQRPELAQFEFRARNDWLGATRNRSEIRDFFGAGKEDRSRKRSYIFQCDEPEVLLGEDSAANPVEYLLNALAGCLTTTLVMHAAARGITIQSLTSELTGDIDIQGFLGLKPDTPRGFKQIEVRMHVKSDASPEQLKELASYSPVFNTISQSTPIVLEIGD